MAPVAVDGSMSRPNTLLISNSHDVYVHHIFLHNSTDWTFRMVRGQTESDLLQHSPPPLQLLAPLPY